MSRSGTQANGVEAWVLDNQDFFLRNVVAVAAGRRVSGGLLIERVEPERIEVVPPAEAGDYPVPERRRVTWGMHQRLLSESIYASDPSLLENDPVVVRVHRDHALAVGTALVEWATGTDPGTAGELMRVRADLERERDRADRLEFALVEAFGRMTPQVTGSHSLVPSKVQP